MDQKISVMKQLLLLVISFFSIINADAQDQVRIQRIQGDIRFDGIVDDPCWNNTSILPMIMHSPTFGTQPTEKSDVMICYDDSYIFIGARLFDSDAQQMLVTSKKRDEGSTSNESLTLILDSFNDKENAMAFSTTPSGLRNDFTILNDAMASNPRNRPFNDSWNTFWDVMTSRDNQGWYLEMRIPFSSLRFKEIDGIVTMGLICFRRIAHKNEVDIYPAISNEWGDYSPYRPSKAAEITLEGINSRKPFYITPYLLAGYQQDNLLNEPGTAYELQPNPKLTVGIDAKYGLTNNLTLDVTVNPDFAQVEADDEQINLTRFSLYFPEKRTFFQERSSIFNYAFEGRNNLFYSRKVGLYKGEQVPIIGGVRLTGMAGKWDLGFLDMQTLAFNSADTSIESLPYENFGILRIRRQVINDNSYLGGIITSKLGMDGSYNTAYGIDGIFRIMKNDYLNIKLSQVIKDGGANNLASLDPSRIYVDWKRFSMKGLGYNFTYSRSGKDFDPGIGFQQRKDYSYYSGSVQYGWLPGISSPLISTQLEINEEIYVNNPSGTIESGTTGLQQNFNFKSGFNGMVGIEHSYENVDREFSLSRDVSVIAGEYRFTQAVAHLHSSASRRFLMNVDAYAGGYYDGNLLRIGLEPEWNIGSSVQLGFAYEYNRAVFSDRDKDFTGNIARLKSLVMFSTKFSLSAFIQYNSVENGVSSNIRLRYNPKEGNDLYIVINEGRNTYRDIENPRLPVFNSRSVLLKYTYTFIL